MSSTYVFRESGAVAKFGTKEGFGDTGYALDAISANTGMFNNGEKLAIVNFDDQVCKFVELRLEMTVIELD